MLSATCKACGASFYVPQELAGQETKCASCGKPVLVPLFESEPETELEIPTGQEVEGGWEYLVISDRGRLGRVDQAKLNKLGAQGWELITVYRDGSEAHATYYFKRQRET